MWKTLGLLIVLFLVLTSTTVASLALVVDTEVPEYILDDHLVLEGRTFLTQGSWNDSTTENFTKGQPASVVVASDCVRLEPSLEIDIMHDGNAILRSGDGTDWDPYIMDPSVILVDGTYYLYYVGAKGTTLGDIRQIGVATSTDGVSFTKYAGNPILRDRFEYYDHDGLMSPRVLHENGTWRMWYSGYRTPDDNNICLATSSDGLNWTKHSGNPVMRHSSNPNTWDGYDVRARSHHREDDTYVMYYSGRGSEGVRRLGRATSTDGINWVKDARNPLYQANATNWENGNTNYWNAETYNGTYRLWTIADPPSWKVGYLLSDDGIEWDSCDAPLIEPVPGTIYSGQIHGGDLLDMGDHLWMYIWCRDTSGVDSFCLFNATKRNMTGSYTSRLFDAGGTVELSSIEWTADVPDGGDLVLQARWGNDTTNLTGWMMVSGPLEVRGVTARTFQYRALFHAHRDWFRVRLTSVVVDYTAPLTGLEVSVDGGPWEEVDGTLEEWCVNLSLEDGDHDVMVRARDLAGAETVETVPVKVDLHPPEGQIVIEEGANATTSPRLDFRLAATDSHGVVEYMLSPSPGMEGGSWAPYVVSGTYDHDGPDGIVTLHARFRDAADRESQVYTDSIAVDRTPPVGNVTINDGAVATAERSVTLDLGWTDLAGVVAMKVSNDPDFEGAEWMDPVAHMDWTLDDGAGLQQVHVRYMDAVGWTGDVTDDIVVDAVEPIASLVISGGATYVTSREVALLVSITDLGTVSYKLANTPDDWPVDWRTGVPEGPIDWTLADGPDGQRTVRLLVRDWAGNEVEVADDVVLDTTPPEASLVLNGGEASTTARVVRATVEASDATSGVEAMRLSHFGPSGEGDWLPPTTSLDWSLIEGTGNRTVYLEVRDAAGLVTVVHASIVLEEVESVYSSFWLILLVIIIVAVTVTIVVWTRQRAGGAPEMGPVVVETPPDGRDREERAREVAALHHMLMGRPGGLPASLWGWDIADLAEAIIDGPRRDLPDGTTAVELGGRWYRLSAEAPEAFLEEVVVDG